MAQLNRARVPMPSAGMNTVSPPGQLPDGKGPLVRNFLPAFPGKMVMRGPIDGAVFNQNIKPEMLGGAERGIISGAWAHNDKIMLGVYEPKAGSVPPWKAPYLRIQEFNKLLGGRLTLGFLDTVANTLTGVGTTAGGGEIPSGPCARLESYTYGYAANGESAGIFADVNGGLQSERKILKWDGSVSKPVVFTNGPRSAQYIKTYLNTLFVLGGQSPEESLGNNFMPSEPEEVSKGAGTTIFKITGNHTAELAVNQLVGALKGTIPTGTKVSAVVYEGGSNKTKVTLNTEVTSLAIGPIYAINQASVRKPEPNTLFYVTPGVAIEDSLTTWKSPTTGLVNRIIVGDDDRNDFGVAMAVVNQILVIFKRKSVWALYGRSPTEFQIRNLTYEFGCIDPWSVCETNQGVYFMSQNGLQYFNGEGFSQVDREIENITTPLATILAGEKADQPWKEQFGRISVTDVGNGYLMLCMSAQNSKETGITVWGKVITTSQWVGMMHMETGNWTEVTTGALEANAFPCLIGKTYSYPWFFDSKIMLDLNSISSYNEKVNLDKTSVGTFGIPALMWTDRIVLSTPGYKSQVHRLMQDYTFPNGANDAGAAAGWWWSLKDGDGTVIQAQTQLPGTGLTATNFLRGRRWEQDNFNEIMDARLEIEWRAASALEVKNPELYDCTLEFSLTQQRRSR